MSPRHAVAAALLAVLAAFGLAACGSPTDTGGANGAAVGADEFTERVARDGVVVLDVRTPAEHAAGHLPDAVNIDVEGGDFAGRLAELDKDASYAVYCRSGSRSGVAVEQMVEAGFTDVVHLAGGIAAWQGAGGDVVTG